MDAIATTIQTRRIIMTTKEGFIKDIRDWTLYRIDKAESEDTWPKRQ